MSVGYPLVSLIQKPPSPSTVRQDSLVKIFVSSKTTSWQVDGESLGKDAKQVNTATYLLKGLQALASPGRRLGPFAATAGLNPSSWFKR